MASLVSQKHVKTLLESKFGVPFAEGLLMGRVLLSSREISIIFREVRRWRIEAGCPCWSGTMTGYKEPGEELGKTIEYTDPGSGKKWVFKVPDQYRREKDAILVVEHPNYLLDKEGDNMVINTHNANIIRYFPPENGYYMGDPIYDIPSGERVSHENDNARYLKRIASRVGPVARGFGYAEFGAHAIMKNINLDIEPSRRLGIIVEGNDTDAPLAQVERSYDERILTMKGLTIEEFSALVGDAERSLEGIAKEFGEEKLAALARIIQAFRIK